MLIVNLGTPDSPSAGDVRKYLFEFLNDPRVIDIPWLSRKLLVNFIIVPFRAPKSAKLYKAIWNEEGSPLKIYGFQVRDLVQQILGDDFQVELAMRYRYPSIPETLQKFSSQNIRKIIVFPMFPQYASASTGSVHELIMKIVSRWEVIPDITFINNYCNHPGFISSFVQVSQKHSLSGYDHILFSFHGLPERQIRKADTSGKCLGQDCCSVLTDRNFFCYRAQSFETARKLAQALQLPENKYTVCFQSRLGRDPWIKPYTDDILKELAAKGVKRILAFAPAFTADCLETIHEIGVEYDEKFRGFGGEKVTMVESLNTHPEWIRTIESIIRQSV